MPGDVQVHVQFQKHVTCGHCAHVYPVGKPRAFIRQGRSEDEARQSAESAACLALDTVPAEPCPHGERVQTEIAARIRFRLYDFLFLLAGALALPLIGVFVGVSGTVGSEFLARFGAGAALAVCVGWGLLLVYCSASRRMRNGSVRAQGGSVVRRFFSLFLRACFVAVLGIGVAVLMMAGPMYRSTHGWQLNGNVTPSICGPGDGIRVTFPDTVTSIKGYWTARVTAQLEVPGESGPPVLLGASSRSDSWGYGVISQGRTSTQPLWAKVQLPGNPALAGKRVVVHVILDVSYPAAVGPEQYRNEQKRVGKNVDVTLSEPGANDAYYQANFWGTFTGSLILLSLIGELALRASSVRRSTIVTLERLSDVVVSPPERDEEPDREPRRPWDRRS